MKNRNNLYTNLKIDLPTLNNVMVEKFIKPSVVTDKEIIWYDKSGLHHSYNGFPSYIEKRENEKYYLIRWHKHGFEFKTHVEIIKLKSEIIAEKIKARNFQERAIKKTKKK